jgi:hypothetical protein
MNTLIDQFASDRIGGGGLVLAYAIGIAIAVAALLTAVT